MYFHCVTASEKDIANQVALSGRVKLPNMRRNYSSTDDEDSGNQTRGKKKKLDQVHTIVICKYQMKIVAK